MPEHELLDDDQPDNDDLAGIVKMPRTEAGKPKLRVLSHEELVTSIRAGIGEMSGEHDHQWVESSRVKMIGGKVFRMDVCVGRYEGAGLVGVCHARRARRVNGRGKQGLTEGQATGHVWR